MSIVNNYSYSTVKTQSSNNGIMFKNYHFGLKRTNKNKGKFKNRTLRGSSPKGTLQVENRPGLVARILIAESLPAYRVLLTNKLTITH